MEEQLQFEEQVDHTDPYRHGIWTLDGVRLKSDQYIRVLSLIAYYIARFNQIPLAGKVDTLISEGRCYYVDLETNGWLKGLIGVSRRDCHLSEIMHLSVHPKFRGQGLGTKLLEHSLTKISTPLCYATVRSTNEASLSIFEKCGFSVVNSYSKPNYTIIFLMRKVPQFI